MTNGDANNQRSARHLALAQIGAAGQARIESTTALLIGVGGIGCAAASYLASSGIGHLMLCDFDTVDASNLGRQTLFGPADIGHPKVSCAAARLGAMNPHIKLTEIPDRLSDHALTEAVSQADIVLDGTDNFATRFQVNDACVSQGRTLVSGSAIRFEGQLVVFGPDYDKSPCYRCLYKEADESLDNCAGNGVFSPVPGVIGTLMAAQAMKHMIGINEDEHMLTLYDGLAGEWRKVRVAKRDDCAVCAA